MRIGSRDKRFAELLRHSGGAPVWIKPTSVEMTPFDRIEAIDLLEQAIADRPAQDIKWMRRKSKKRIAASGSQFPEIIKGAQTRDLVRSHIKKHYVSSLQSHFRRRDQQNSHRRGVGENFRPIKDVVVQSNGEHTKPELARSFQQLMGGIIDMVLRIIERVNVKIEFDPIFGLRVHCLNLRAKRGPFICESSAPSSELLRHPR